MSAPSEVVVVPYQDGPYLIRGPVVIRDQDGNAIDQSRSPVALCRCGKSRMRPFCDGTHQLIHFQAPSEQEGPARGVRDPVVRRPVTTNRDERLREAVAALLRAARDLGVRP